MIILLSPAKTLNFKPHSLNLESSEITFKEEPQQLVNKLSKMSVKKLQELMHISKDLAVLNKKRYIDFDLETINKNGKEAILAFNGGVYQGLDANTLPVESFDYLQDHVRILSGLYGVLKPLDKIHEYRLEMSTTLPVQRKKNLYGFWGDKITNLLNHNLKEIESETIINCASQEYFQAVNQKKLKARVINVQFKEMHDGTLKFISFNAKKARGLMTRYAADHSISNPELLKGFNYENYGFDSSLSSENEWYFIR